jgi:hypothetical protein
MEGKVTIDPEDVYTRIVRLSIRAEQNFIELGRLLRELKKLDKTLFKQVYVATGLGRRRAYHFIAIVRQFEGLPITDAQLAGIGWTKADIIGKHITPENGAELLAEAEKRSARDLRIIMGGGQPVRGTRSVTLYLKPDQYQRFVKAVEAHGGKAPDGSLKFKERALMTIIAAAESAAT